MKTATFGPIDIFRTGTFKPMNGDAVTYSAADLDTIVSTYDANNAPAPVVLGHPKTDAPAYAWVDRLFVEGNKLKATIAKATPEFVEMVKGEKYKKVSPSFFGPDAPNNPTPGKWHLKHVGFLGAATPAVSGLEPVAFADVSDNAGCFEFSMPVAHSLNANDHSELKQLRKEKLQSSVESLIASGRLLPALKNEVLEFVGELDGTTAFEFAEGDPVTPRDWFLSYLAKQPKIVSFGSVDFGPDINEATSKMSVPNGYTVDPNRSELNNKVLKIQREKNVSFSEALEIALDS